MFLIDTHSHMYDSCFESEWNKIEENNSQAKVELVLLPNVDATTIPLMHATVEKNPNRYKAMMGLHPTSVKENYKEELALVYHHLSQQTKDYIAVGEIGMDLYWDTQYEAIQREAFITQMEWANEFVQPVSIHARKTTHLLIDILKKEVKSNEKGIFHCFSGSIEEAKQIIGLGFKLGIGGVVTFKNSNLPATLLEVGLTNIVIETDAPYLAPDPYRGKQNESSYSRLVAYKLASIFNTSIDEVMEVTTQNAFEIFKKLNSNAKK